MQTFLDFADGAPVATLLLTAIVAFSLLGLFVAPRFLDHCLLRPYRLVREGEWWTVVTSTLVHADLAHLLFNGFTFWAFAKSMSRHSRWSAARSRGPATENSTVAT